MSVSLLSLPSCRRYGRSSNDLSRLQCETVLLKSGNSAAADVLDEEYEEMVSSIIFDHGMEVLSTTEGKTSMEDMGKPWFEATEKTCVGHTQ